MCPTGDGRLANVWLEGSGQHGQVVESPTEVDVLPHHLPLVEGVGAEHDGVGLSVAALYLLQSAEHRDLLTVREEAGVHQTGEDVLESADNCKLYIYTHMI